jgi:hypothetical protein
MKRAVNKWPAKLAAGEKAKTDTCLYVPPNALPNVTLPARVIVHGANRNRALVGRARVDGADDETVIWVSPDLLAKVAPGHEHDLTVEVELERASWADVVRLMDGDDRFRVLGSAVVAAAAIAAAVVAFLTREVGVAIAASVLALGALAACIAFWSEIRGALRPKCG